MRSYGEIRCPHCKVCFDAEDLEQTSEYGCWSGEETNVECLDCNKSFTVKCEHAGYKPTDDFDARTWCKENIKSLPEDILNECGWSLVFQVVCALEHEQDVMLNYRDRMEHRFAQNRQRVFNFVDPIWKKYIGSPDESAT